MTVNKPIRQRRTRKEHLRDVVFAVGYVIMILALCCTGLIILMGTVAVWGLLFN